MDFNIEVRRKQLENLDQFISSSKDRVESILDYLSWTKEKINESHKEMAKCLFDPHHRIPASKAAKHMQKCSFRKESYDKNEKFLSEPNPVPGSTILIDDATKIQVLSQALSKNPLMKTGWRTGESTPRTSDRLLSVYTYDEREALYDYAVASTSGPPPVPEFNTTETKKEEKSFSLEEIKVLKRDSRRRRIKYKAKSVHSSRKNTTEIMREVINGQMEAYEDWLRHELNIETSSIASTPQNREPVSPISSSRHSIENEFRRSEPRNRYRSQSKDSEVSKYTNRSRESNRYKHRERSVERDISNNRNRVNINEFSNMDRSYDTETSFDRERSRRRHTDRSRSGSNSRKYDRERRYDKERNYEVEKKCDKVRKYDNHESYSGRDKYDNYNRHERREKDERHSFKREKSKDRYYNDDRCSNRKYLSHSVTVKEEYE